MGRAESWVGYLCAGFFAIGIPVFIIQLLPGSTYLTLTRDGFTMCSFFRKMTTPWSDVDCFFVVVLQQNGLKAHHMVGFDYVASYDRSRLGRGIAKAIAHCEGALPDTYGKKPEELADMLNACLQSVRTNQGEQRLAAGVEDGAAEG